MSWNTIETAARHAQAMVDVSAERERQERHVAAGRFKHTCGDPRGMTHADRLAVLAEEVGEVAREVLAQDGRQLARDSLGTPAALRAELVQVAAVAVAWIEALS